MKKMKLVLLIAASACALAVLSTKASIVVPNGDFETQSAGVAADWTVGNTPAVDTASMGVGGSYGEVFGPGASQIHQDIDLGGSGHGPALTYQVAFYAMNLITDPSSFVANGQFEITLDGATPVFITVATGTDISGYQEYFADFTTTDLGLKSLTIKWTGTADTGNLQHNNLVTHGEGLLDDVSVSSINVVPEPTTIISGALLLLPFGAGVARKLCKKHTA